MSVSESLKSAENSLRDLFNFILSKELGNEWVNSCGVSKERIKRWEERKLVDEQKFGHSDPRLIYYAVFMISKLF